MIINIHNPVLASVSPRDGKRLTPCLSFNFKYYVREPRKDKGNNLIFDDNGKMLMYMKPMERRNDAFVSKGDRWYFHTGLMHRVRDYLNKACIEFATSDTSDYAPDYDPRRDVSDTITLKDFQYKFARRCAAKQRGLIKSATGTGKTIIMLAICDWFHKSNILILAHTNSIVTQTIKVLGANGFNGDIQQIGAGVKFEGLYSEIVVSTIQSFAKIDASEYENYFDVVMVDEVHHVSKVAYSFDRYRNKKSGQYCQVLEHLMSPIRLGFTATPPDTPQKVFACEGLIGPLIGEMTLEEATKLGILAEPVVKIVKLNPQSHIRQLKTYPDIYKEGVVQNLRRNSKVLEIAKSHVKNGETILIFITHLEHGERLFNLAKTDSVLKKYIAYVRGATDAESREQVRLSFQDKEIRCVIASAVWTEGVDIPSLDAIIMATSEKSAKQTIQKVGRGLRKTDGKDKVIIYDFFDESHIMLIRHFGHRFSLYCDLGFIK